MMLKEFLCGVGSIGVAVLITWLVLMQLTGGM